MSGGRGGEDRVWTNVKYYCQEGEEERTGSGLPTLDMGSKLAELKKTRKLGTDITLKVSP